VWLGRFLENPRPCTFTLVLFHHLVIMPYGGSSEREGGGVICDVKGPTAAWMTMQGPFAPPSLSLSFAPRPASWLARGTGGSGAALGFEESGNTTSDICSKQAKLGPAVMTFVQWGLRLPRRDDATTAL
jgi:hypothetical protein